MTLGDRIELQDTTGDGPVIEGRKRYFGWTPHPSRCPVKAIAGRMIPEEVVG